MLFAVVATATLVASGVALAVPSSTPDPDTVQTNGRVRAIVKTDDTVYLGGTFAQVTDTNGNVVARNNLAAIDANTGKLKSWNPNANGPVETLEASADGSRIYMGGDFTAVQDVARARVAAVNANTGALTGWNPAADSTVRAIAAKGNRVYLGGGFMAIGGQPRQRLALVDGTTGALRPNWRPRTNNTVRALAFSSQGGRLYVGGGYTLFNGIERPYLAAVNTKTGVLDTTFRPPTPNGRIWDIEQAGDRVYTAEGGPGGRARAYEYGGRRAFNHRTAGDVQAVTVMENKAYYGGHFESIADKPCQGLAAVNATTGAVDNAWNPTVTPRYLGVWALTPDRVRSRMYVGGDFTRVSGVPHQYFARFS